MGGNVFAETKRLTRSEMERIVCKVGKVLDAIDGIEWKQPAEISDKPDFGDVDIHFTCSDIENGDTGKMNKKKSIAFEAISKAVNSTERSGESILSSERYQIDLSFYWKHMFDISVASKSNGDFMWLINIGLRRVGLKLNENGLVLRKGFKYNSVPETFSHLNKDFLLTCDLEQIQKFVGVQDTAVFYGEKSLSYEEVFQIVCSCRHFQREYFVGYDSLIKAGKIKSRPMINKFLKYLDEHPEIRPMASPRTDPEQEYQYALAFFHRKEAFDHAVQLEIEKLHERLYKSKCFEKIGGVANIKTLFPEIQGREIGQLIQAVKWNSWQSTYDWLEKKDKGQVDDILRQSLTMLRKNSQKESIPNLKP